jgi:hypothetical protein
LSAWWTRSRQRDDHERELRVELASVLDGAVSSLGRAKRSFERIYAMYLGNVDPTSDEAREVFEGRRRAMQDVRYAGDRIAIRLGSDHETHRAYAECADTLEQQLEFARAYEREPSVEPAVLERLHRAHERFDPTREAFVEAARQVVGPKLG